MDSAKWQLAMLRLLLQDDAAQAKKIVSEYKPLFSSKEEYLAFMDSLDRSGDRITYGENGIATIQL